MAGAATMGPVVPGGWIEYRPDNRGFAAAVVVSVVFHGALLAGWHSMHRLVLKPAIAPGPIVARLAAAPKPAAAPASSRPVDDAPGPRAKGPSPPARVAKPRPTPLAKPSPVPAPTKAAPAPSPVPASPAAEPATSAAATPAAPSAPAIAAKAEPQQANVQTPAQAADADPGTLKQYQLAIIIAARKYKRYPRAAMENNWQGRVEVRMVIGANGMIAAMSIKTSAGHELLDKTAMDMIAKAKPLTPIPTALLGKEFAVDVPVIFSLKEDAPGG